MNSPLKPSQLLADPAKWGKGFAHKRPGTFCVMEAIAECYPEAMDPACERLCAHVGDSRLTNWNDAPERTHSEILAALVACDL